MKSYNLAIDGEIVRLYCALEETNDAPKAGGRKGSLKPQVYPWARLDRPGFYVDFTFGLWRPVYECAFLSIAFTAGFLTVAAVAAML